MSKAIDNYLLLRQEVDRKAMDLAEIHRDRLNCRAMCPDCCVNLSVWPVEFFSIVEEMKRARWPRPEWDEGAGCGFLKDGLCQIYPFRPIICRTHGLPLVYLPDDERPDEYAVSFCEKNFVGVDIETFVFTPANTLHLDEINERLARIHTAFLEERGESSPFERRRIELREILEYL